MSRYKCKNVLISEHFNKKIDYIDDRRHKSNKNVYILDALTRKSFHSDRLPGLWRFYFDNLEDAVFLENSLIYLRLCFCGETHMYPPVVDGCQKEIEFEEDR